MAGCFGVGPVQPEGGPVVVEGPRGPVLHRMAGGAVLGELAAVVVGVAGGALGGQRAVMAVCVAVDAGHVDVAAAQLEARALVVEEAGGEGIDGVARGAVVDELPVVPVCVAVAALGEGGAGELALAVALLAVDPGMGPFEREVRNAVVEVSDAAVQSSTVWQRLQSAPRLGRCWSAWQSEQLLKASGR